MFLMISILMLVLVYSLIKYQKYIIGWFGENYAKKELKKLPKEDYIILNDIMIELNDNTYQIDHIVVSKYGIFVIETKQYNGYIYGDKYDKKWIRKCKRKDIYYTNPIRQNYGHVLAICELLNIEKEKVFNIVYIPSTAKIDVKHDGEVVLGGRLYNKIKSFQNIIINNSQEISNIILSRNIIDKKLRTKHNERVKTIINFNNDCCPKCGSKLLEKDGKYGVFLGCSNYPKCKYTRKVK